MHFRSTAAIAKAEIDEIAAVPGLNRVVAEKIKRWLAGMAE